jgi:hypothetical protein
LNSQHLFARKSVFFANTCEATDSLSLIGDIRVHSAIALVLPLQR